MTAIIVACISSVAIILAAVIPAYVSLKRGQNEIHFLVNSRLTEALNEIRRLGGQSKDF